MPATPNGRLENDDYKVTLWNHGVMVEPKDEDSHVWYPREE